MKYLLSLLVVALLFSNCQSDSKEEEETAPVATEESTERLDTVFSAADIGRLNQLRFSQFSQGQNPVDWSKFRMVTSTHDSLLVTAFQPDSSYYRLYGRMLKFSPDSTMFVDLDSYNIEFQKNSSGKQVPVGKGPDTEVSLVSLPEKKKTRLVFLGPGNGVEDGGWIDNQTVMLVGYHETDTTKLKKAVIWRYHVPTKTFHIYESADTSIPAQLLRWRKARFASL